MQPLHTLQLAQAGAIRESHNSQASAHRSMTYEPGFIPMLRIPEQRGAKVSNVV